MSQKDTGGARGWSMRAQVDEQGRTRSSISVGRRTVVRDALDTDAAVIAARRRAEERERLGRPPGGEAGGPGGGEDGREGAKEK